MQVDVVLVIFTYLIWNRRWVVFTSPPWSLVDNNYHELRQAFKLPGLCYREYSMRSYVMSDIREPGEFKILVEPNIL